MEWKWTLVTDIDVTRSKKFLCPKGGLNPGLAMWVSIIASMPPRTLIAVTFTLRRENMYLCISSLEIALATKSNSGSNRWYNLKKFCASVKDLTLVPCYLGERHNRETTEYTHRCHITERHQNMNYSIVRTMNWIFYSSKIGSMRTGQFDGSRNVRAMSVMALERCKF